MVEWMNLILFEHYEISIGLCGWIIIAKLVEHCLVADGFKITNLICISLLKGHVVPYAFKKKDFKQGNIQSYLTNKTNSLNLSFK